MMNILSKNQKEEVDLVSRNFAKSTATIQQP